MNFLHIQQFITQDQVEILNAYSNHKPPSEVKTIDYNGQKIVRTVHRDCDYHVSDSVVHELLYEKLHKVLGPHTFDHGSFVESHFPYPLHVDTHETFIAKNIYTHTDQKLNASVLICLNDHPLFSTVFFDYFTEIFDIEQSLERCHKQIDSLSHDSVDLTHLSDRAMTLLSHINITNVAHWRVGDCLIWPRDQLHCSSNFLASGLQKKALVMFF